MWRSSERRVVSLGVVAVTLAALGAPAAAHAEAQPGETLVAEASAPDGTTYRLFARPDERGVCTRLEAGASPAPERCAPVPTDPAGDPATALETRFPFVGPSVLAATVSPPTAALRISDPSRAQTLPSVPGPTAARHVLAVLAPGRFSLGVVEALDADGRLLGVGGHDEPPQAWPRVSLAKQQRYGFADGRDILDVAGSLAAGRILRVRHTCVSWYIYRAPLQSTWCWPAAERLPEPVQCNDAYGTTLSGLAPGAAHIIEVRDRRGRTVRRARAARLPALAGYRTAFTMEPYGSGSAGFPRTPRLRTLLVRSRGGRVLARRGLGDTTLRRCVSVPPFSDLDTPIRPLTSP